MITKETHNHHSKIEKTNIHWETRFLLPEPTLKDNEIYAPSFRDGEEVVVVHFPLTEIIEIPVLKVTNRSEAVRAKFGPAMDVVAVNKNVINRFPGADFNGYTVSLLPLSVFINLDDAQIENN